MKCFCGSNVTIREHRDIDGDYSYSWICTNKECGLSKYLFDTREEAEQNIAKIVRMNMSTELLETISNLEKRIEELEESERLRCEREIAKLEGEIKIARAETKAREQTNNMLNGFSLPPNVSIKLL